MRATKQTKLYGELLYEVTKESAEDSLAARIADFVKILGKKKNVQWNKVIETFEKTYNEKEGIVEAQVTARHRMDKEEQEEILSFIKDLYPGKQINVTDHLDERVVGGCKVQIGDRLFDFTVQNSLAALRKQLTQ